MTIEVKNAGFRYGKTHVLKDVSFSAQSGDLVAVLGPNGAGKTTLLRCLLGFLKWTEGGSFLDGKNIREIPSKKLWQKISYVPQAKSFTSGATVLEAVLLGRTSSLSLFEQPKQKDIDIARKLLSDLSIPHLEGKRCSEISGGELQMALICRALASEPQILVLDEPESNLDFKNQLIVLDAMTELTGKGMTCIFNTHYPAHALSRSNKALLLSKGGGYVFGDTARVVTEENIESSFGVRTVIGDVETDESTLKSITALEISNGNTVKPQDGENRLAIISIIASDYSQGERISELLHAQSKYLIGRMGMPYRKSRVNIINVTLEAPYGEINALVSRLSQLSGVSVKATYAKNERTL